MEVNITLILQVLQFMCGYFFLRRFLFVPACKILDEEDLFKMTLYKNLERQQQIKDSLLQDYYVKNNKCKHLLQNAIPSQATELIYQKTTLSTTLYAVEKIQVSQQDREKAETFLIDHLSQVKK